MITRQIKISHKQSDSFCGPQPFGVILASPRMLFLCTSSYLMDHLPMGHFYRGFVFFISEYMIGLWIVKTWFLDWSSTSRFENIFEKCSAMNTSHDAWLVKDLFWSVYRGWNWSFFENRKHFACVRDFTE